MDVLRRRGTFFMLRGGADAKVQAYEADAKVQAYEADTEVQATADAEVRATRRTRRSALRGDSQFDPYAPYTPCCGG